jgi:hypothetical protein
MSLKGIKTKLMESMKSTSMTLLMALLAGGSLSLTGCIVATPEPSGYVNTEIGVPSDPPPLLVETVPEAPGVGFVWVGGGWAWHNHWVWEPGRWQRPPGPGLVWHPHRYEYRNGRRVFIRGGWR